MYTPRAYIKYRRDLLCAIRGVDIRSQSTTGFLCAVDLLAIVSRSPVDNNGQRTRAQYPAAGLYGGSDRPPRENWRPRSVNKSRRRQSETPFFLRDDPFSFHKHFTTRIQIYIGNVIGNLRALYIFIYAATAAPLHRRMSAGFFCTWPQWHPWVGRSKPNGFRHTRLFIVVVIFFSN